MIGLRAPLSATAILLAGVLLVGCTASRSQIAPGEPASSASTASASSSKPPASAPRAYFFGDSWTHGAAAPAGQGFPQVVGRALGWRVEVGPDLSGAGYTNTFAKPHPVFPVAVERLPRIDADLIVLEGGLNDEIATPKGPALTGVADEDAYAAAVERTVERLRDRTGGAPVVLVGPMPPSGTARPALQRIDAMEAQAAARVHATYVSPIQEHWFAPADRTRLIDTTIDHPNGAGHAYFATRLASALVRTFGLDPRVTAPRSSAGTR